MQNSPGSPTGTGSPESGSVTLISTCGCTLPTVDTRRSSESSAPVCVDTGEVSVIPYAMVTSSMCISLMTRFITSTGQGEPAMQPVRSDDTSYDAKSGNPSSAMNMVGTPYSEVQRSS